MPDKANTISIFGSIADGDSARVTAESCSVSLKTVQRHSRVLERLKKRESDAEIHTAVPEWREETIATMRRWAIEAGIIPPGSNDSDLGKQSPKSLHIDALVMFAFNLSKSLIVPIPAALSGIARDRWDDPYSGSLLRQPSIRALKNEREAEHYSELDEHLPGLDLDSKIEKICTSLAKYAKACRGVVNGISQLYYEQGVSRVPEGALVAAFHFAADVAESGKTSEISPVIETMPSGEIELRTGGWLSKFTEHEKAERVRDVFGQVVRSVSGSARMKALVEARESCKKSICDLRFPSTTEDGLRIIIARTSCVLCMSQPGKTVQRVESNMM